MDYIDLEYKPEEDELITTYRLEPSSGVSLEEASGHVAGESSIGTWTDLSTMKPDIALRLKPTVFEMDGESNVIKIAYPRELFEDGSMPQILSSIAGNIFGMNAIENLRLEDIKFPPSMIKRFRGPAFGIQGVRDLVGVKERPLVGTIVKPKVGLSPKEHAEVAYSSWVGGCDIVKDDENLTDQVFNRFRDRVAETIKLRDKAENETGEMKIYMPNVTAETEEMMRRVEFVKEHGGRYVMIDILTSGFSALQTLRDKNPGLVIHAHRAMHAALTRNKRHGISMLTLAKISRLIGVDQLHIGTVVGKMEGGRGEVTVIQKAITDELYGMKSTFPVCSGGLHPGLVEPLIEIMGGNIIIQAGGGIHGHPGGTEAGAKAMRQAVDAEMEGVSPKEYAEGNPQLKEALDKWG